MKNIHWISAAAAVLVLAGLACGGGDGETPTVIVEEPPTTIPTNTPQPQPQPEGTTLEITNNSGVAVWYVYISPADADEWGEDWLGDEMIDPGETHTIVGIPEGTYDVKAADENNETIQVTWEAKVEGDMTWDITGLSSFEVVNNSDDAIYYLYIALSDAATWGEDWLGDQVIEPGASFVVDGVPRGTYDIKAAEDDDSSVEIVYNISLPEKNNWTVVGKTPLPGNAVLRFEEAFEDNRNNWGLDTETENVFYMSPAGGEYCMLIKSDNFTAWEWYEPFRTDEFVAEVGCYFEGAEDATCGLGFGPDGDNIYWYEVSPSDQTFALFLLENGSWQENLIDWTVSRNISPSGANYLSMERLEGVVSLYVNGVLIGQVNSDRFPEGRVGLGGSTYSEGNTTVCLDNLRVWRLE